MFYQYTDEELRTLCRSSIETLETWAKRLIDEKMSEKYGSNYLDIKVNKDCYLIKKDIRDHVHQKMEKEPDRFSKLADALLFDEMIYILCHPQLYKQLFKEALEIIYPQGREEAHEFLQRLSPIRNNLSHSIHISTHQAEQAVCYSHDFIEGLKKYYKGKDMEKVWNVPSIISVKDSLGNIFENLQESSLGVCCKKIDHDFYCGEEYSIFVEMDTSFPPEKYDIKWSLGTNNHQQTGGQQFKVEFNTKDVGKNKTLSCTIISKESWHKYSTYDFKLLLSLCVLPPIS